MPFYQIPLQGHVVCSSEGVFMVNEKIYLISRFGMILSVIMLICAIFFKSVPTVPFILVEFLILQFLGWKVRGCIGERKGKLGREFLYFIAIFMIFGFASIVIKPGL